ncbi:zeta toxin family protein [Terriglobus sp. ADX1]|uniref:zeta toxin family protein n=1 Tax=Terriglobus sp. ADX1 TaxID=2794063 RepID=UPI002FE56466
MPTLTVVAGPNGSGKSTLTKWNRETFQTFPVLDPDAVAKSLNASGSAGSAIDAGRAVLTLADQLLTEGRSFVVETTLSGNTYIRMMQRAKAAGYHMVFLFVGTQSVEINLVRVRNRVIKGGHDVPEEDQRRRFERSMRHMQTAFELADDASLYDNSDTPGYALVAVKTNGATELFEPLPKWAEFLREETA